LYISAENMIAEEGKITIMTKGVVYISR
jgi:hypothetical protein